MVLTVLVLIVLTTPYLFILGMGIIALLDETVLPHTGIGLLTLGWLSYSFFIALGHWYYKNVIFGLQISLISSKQPNSSILS